MIGCKKNYNKFKLFYLNFIPQKNVGKKVLLHYWNRKTALELLKLINESKEQPSKDLKNKIQQYCVDSFKIHVNLELSFCGLAVVDPILNPILKILLFFIFSHNSNRFDICTTLLITNTIEQVFVFVFKLHRP